MEGRLKAFAAVLFAVGCLLALPGVAGAVVHTVNSTGDAPDNGAPNGVCETVTPGECTLRAAIQESNATAGVKDTILFNALVFEGQLADTIAPLAALPSLTSPVEINAGSCATAAGVNGPCAGVNGPIGEVGLEVTADETTIVGLAITGVSFGIGVFSASTDFTARGNWLGVKLDGSAGANSNVGIFVDPNSDGATIGSFAAADRNVISNTAGTGLDLEGASEATIQGNYFGVAPDGASQMSNGKDVEITGRLGFTPAEDIEAEDNEIGATIEGAALTSDACDGSCNVISGALGTGIDLNGSVGQAEKPASGPTIVHGNFIGLNAAGTAAIANAGIGIWAGGADHVRVGAPLFSALAPERNYIAGGSEGIVSESGGNDFQARGNSLGFGSDGTDVTPPLERGIFALALSVSEESNIESNDVRMVGGVGIEVRFQTGRSSETTWRAVDAGSGSEPNRGAA
jgi:CSLREA domain-containing protein